MFAYHIVRGTLDAEGVYTHAGAPQERNKSALQVRDQTFTTGHGCWRLVGERPFYKLRDVKLLFSFLQQLLASRSKLTTLLCVKGN